MYHNFGKEQRRNCLHSRHIYLFSAAKTTANTFFFQSFYSSFLFLVPSWILRLPRPLSIFVAPSLLFLLLSVCFISKHFPTVSHFTESFFPFSQTRENRMFERKMFWLLSNNDWASCTRAQAAVAAAAQTAHRHGRNLRLSLNSLFAMLHTGWNPELRF